MLYHFREYIRQGIVDKVREKYLFVIADKLMNDEHYLVLKGYGWMLKVHSTVKQDDVYYYLNKTKDQMPRVSFRLEKCYRTDNGYLAEVWIPII
jgi:3-methyladenine DNA glycosylase AlkD